MVRRVSSFPSGEVQYAPLKNPRQVRCALEAAGVEFIDENGGGPGVRLRKRQQNKG